MRQNDTKRDRDKDTDGMSETRKHIQKEDRMRQRETDRHKETDGMSKTE